MSEKTYTAKDMRRAIVEGAELGAIAFNGAMPNQFRAQVEQKARDRYPDPHRTLIDPHDRTVKWRATNGEVEYEMRRFPEEPGEWRSLKVCSDTTFTPTPERIRLWYDLLTNPNE